MFDWNQVDTVLLDMDGTLLDLHYDHYFWLTHLPTRYASFHQIDLAEAQSKLTQFIHLYEGTLQWYCLDHWSELTGLDIPALKKEIQHKIQVRPHTKRFLSYLKHLNKRVVMATNAHRSSVDLKLSATQIGGWFDLIISSHDYQTPKEELAFWHELQQNEPFDPSRTVFVDDNVQVLRTAKNFGIHHLICINQPNLQAPAKPSGEFLDIIDFHQVVPNHYE